MSMVAQGALVGLTSGRRIAELVLGIIRRLPEHFPPPVAGPKPGAIG